MFYPEFFISKIFIVLNVKLHYFEIEQIYLGKGMLYLAKLYHDRGTGRHACSTTIQTPYIQINYRNKQHYNIGFTINTGSMSPDQYIMNNFST